MSYNASFTCALISILLLLSAFFSCSETALVSINKIALKKIKKENRKGAKTLSALLDKDGEYLTTLLIGNNVVNAGITALATAFAVNILGEGGAATATAVVTILVTVFAEIIPKTLAARRPETTALIVAKPAYALNLLFKPVAFILSLIANAFTKLVLSRSGGAEPTVTEEELLSVIDTSKKNGVLESAETYMLNNAFRFSDKSAREIMISRTHVAAVEINASEEELASLFRGEGFSRLPVYERTIDVIKGVVHYKDFLYARMKKQTFSLAQIMRPPVFIPETAPITKVLEQMKKEKQNMLIIIDEHGGTSGIVALDDIISEIFGAVSDEYNGENLRQTDEHGRQPGGGFLVSGDMELSQLNELAGTSFHSEYYNTVGGFLMEQFSYLPKKGEVCQCENTRFTIKERSEQRIEQALVEPRAADKGPRINE